MPSVRVRRAGGPRPYTVIDSPENRAASLRPTSPASGRPTSTTPSNRISPTSPVDDNINPRTSQARRRGTITSFFNRTSSPPPVSPTDGAPNAYGSQRRRDGFLAADEQDNFRGSLVADSCLRRTGGRTATQASDPRNYLQPPTSPERERRSSQRSYGTEPPAIDIRLSRDDLEGRVGSALSLPEDELEEDSDYDEHHHDEIVDHLDVIGELRCADTLLRLWG